MSSALRSPAELPRYSTVPWPAIGLGLVVLLAAFRHTWADMARVWWTSETFGHGMVVPALAAWLAWRSRHRLDGLHCKPDWRGGVAFAAACALWIVAELAGTAVVGQFALTAAIPALIWAVAGITVLRVMAAPLAFLFFMVPAGEALNPILMEGTADATIAAIRAVGIPVYREGLHFSLPTGRWSVVEACSGLRYVIAAGMLATLFAIINFRSAAKRLVFISVALVLAILANWARAFVVVMAGHVSDMKWGVGDDHVVFGWVFFGVVMFGVFAMGARWRDADASVVPASGAAVAGTSTASARPLDARALSVAAMLAALAVGSVLAVGAARDVQPRDEVGREAASIVGPLEGGSSGLRPSFVGARAAVQGMRPDGVDVYVAYFARQREGSEMIAYGNAVLPSDGGWAPISIEDRIEQVDGTPLRVREQRVRAGSAERLAWSWYTVGGMEVGGSEYRAKAGTAWAMATGRGDHSTVSVVSVPLPAMPAAASDQEVQAVMASARARLAPAATSLRRASAEATGR